MWFFKKSSSVIKWFYVHINYKYYALTNFPKYIEELDIDFGSNPLNYVLLVLNNLPHELKKLNVYVHSTNVIIIDNLAPGLIELKSRYCKFNLDYLPGG